MYSRSSWIGNKFRFLGAPDHNAEIISDRGNSRASFKLVGYGPRVWVVPCDVLLQSFADAIPHDSSILQRNCALYKSDDQSY